MKSWKILRDRHFKSDGVQHAEPWGPGARRRPLQT